MASTTHSERQMRVVLIPKTDERDHEQAFQFQTKQSFFVSETLERDPDGHLRKVMKRKITARQPFKNNRERRNDLGRRYISSSLVFMDEILRKFFGLNMVDTPTTC